MDTAVQTIIEYVLVLCSVPCVQTSVSLCRHVPYVDLIDILDWEITHEYRYTDVPPPPLPPTRFCLGLLALALQLEACLSAVAAAEELDVSSSALCALAQFHMGDLRACLLTLQVRTHQDLRYFSEVGGGWVDFRQRFRSYSTLPSVFSIKAVML